MKNIENKITYKYGNLNGQYFTLWKEQERIHQRKFSRMFFYVFKDKIDCNIKYTEKLESSPEEIIEWQLDRYSRDLLDLK